MYDLQEQQEEEQFKEDSTSTMSKEVYKILKEEKKEEKEKTKSKHKAVFTRKDAVNCYICDNCGELYQEDKGSLIYNKNGEFAYCNKCLKELYPNYRKVLLATKIKKTDYMSNHYDTKYFNGLY